MYKLFITIAAVLLVACTSKKKPVVINEDVSLLMKQKPAVEPITAIETDMQFWSNRLANVKDDVSSQVKLASLYSHRFQYSGLISDIKKSDSLYNVANQLQKHFGSALYRSLAANAITQHRFLLADSYLDTAETIGDDLYLTRLQQFDVKLELGQYKKAEDILTSFRYKNNFDYYIRAAKLEDHKGNSDVSIGFMEKAYADIKGTGKETLLLWVKTNLADMYGHNNRIAESYKLYNEVLTENPAYYHAWKGVAWIAYSHDKNTSLAKQILLWLQEKHPVPDYDLMLSEIAAYEQDNNLKNQHIASFIDKAVSPAYGDMYNKYIFSILSDDLNDHSKAMSIAKKELANRPTPQSYELFAWSLYRQGNVQEAAKIAGSYIVNKTFEPDALYHIGIIYKQAGNKKLAKQYLTEALESSFELGPLVTTEIKEELKRL